jgi:ferredoxin
MYRIQIDRSLCSGFGACTELAPEVLAAGPDGLVTLRTGLSADPAVLHAAEACPMAAISITEEEAGPLRRQIAADALERPAGSELELAEELAVPGVVPHGAVRSVD